MSVLLIGIVVIQPSVDQLAKVHREHRLELFWLGELVERSEERPVWPPEPPVDVTVQALELIQTVHNGISPSHKAMST